MQLPSEIKSKYRNKISQCLLKHRHDSRAEADYCNSLLADKQAGRIISFKVQVSYLVAPGITHVVDFEVTKLMSGVCGQDDMCLGQMMGQEIEVHDVKGFETDVWKIKYKLFVEKYPHIKYVVINRKEDSPWMNSRKTPAFPVKLRRSN